MKEQLKLDSIPNDQLKAIAWIGFGVESSYEAPSDLQDKTAMYSTWSEWGCPLNIGPELVL